MSSRMSSGKLLRFLTAPSKVFHPFCVDSCQCKGLLQLFVAYSDFWRVEQRLIERSEATSTTTSSNSISYS